MKKIRDFFRDISFEEPNQFCSGKNYFFATVLISFLVLLHTGVGYSIINEKIFGFNYRYALGACFVYCAVLIIFLISYPLFVIGFVRPKQLTRYLINGYGWHLFSKERLLFSYPVLLMIFFEQSTYTAFKNEIPNLNPFWLDGLLYKIDRVIFLGNDPWWVLQRIFGNPDITRMIDFLYLSSWMKLVIAALIFHALGRHSLKSRLRFFVAYIIVWFGLGNLLATVLSSAGPCYFTQVTGQPSPYTELMSYLYSIKVNGNELQAIKIQKFLWNVYVNNRLENGSGISAMPSIHVATAALFALSVRNIYPTLGKILYVFAFIIWLGSIHLGWHYASDGLVSGLCVIVIWYFSGLLTEKVIVGENVIAAAPNLSES